MPESRPSDLTKEGSKRSLFKILGGGCLLLLMVVGAGQVYYIFLAGNFHAVIPGRVYRCGQLSGEALEKVVAEHHIRTVVNLRGSSPASPWYLDECRATSHLNVGVVECCQLGRRGRTFQSGEQSIRQPKAFERRKSKNWGAPGRARGCPQVYPK